MYRPTSEIGFLFHEKYQTNYDNIKAEVKAGNQANRTTFNLRYNYNDINIDGQLK